MSKQRFLFNGIVIISMMLNLVPMTALAAPVAVPVAAPIPEDLDAPQALDAGGVTVEGTPTIATGTSGTTITWSHTTGTGTDRLLLVGVSWNANTCTTCTISSIKFTPSGGSAISLTEVISRKYASNYRYAAIYSLVNPPSGTASTILVTFGGSISSGGIVAGAANFAGVDQTTPLGFPNGADASSISASVTLIGLAGDELVFDNLMLGGTTTSATTVAPQTQLPGWNVFSSNARGLASTEQATGGTVVMDWTLGASGIWVDVAVPINPACTGPHYNLVAGNAGHGTVTLYPVGGSYCSGKTVTLTPAPDSGYQFSGWTGANASEIAYAGGVYTILMDGDKSVTANFAPQTCQDVFLTVDDDTYLSAASTTTNYGNSTTLQVNQNTGTTRRTALLRWNDLNSIPANAFINTASIQLQVTDASTIAYPLYDLTRAWVEGNGTAGSGATWATYDGTNAWGAAGASQTTGSVDRGITNLWNSTASSFSPVGSKTVTLNTDGLAIVRQWLTGGANNGVIIQQYSSTDNTLYFDSAEGATPPRLNINYCLPNNTAPAQPTLASPADGATDVSTSPTLDVTVSDTDANATDVTFYGREVGAGTWQNLGTAYAVASEAHATMAWPGLTESTQYEWYVTVSDGPATTTGPTWSFTPGPAGITYELTMAADPPEGGTTDPAVGSHTYAENAVVNINASPATGYSFVNWTGAVADPDLASTTVTMDADKTVTAHFSINQYPLNLTFGGSGGGRVTSSPSGIDCTNDCYHDFDYNTPVVLTATADPDSLFSGWTGEGCSGTSTCSVTMTEARNVAATFVPAHNLTIAVDPVVRRNHHSCSRDHVLFRRYGSSRHHRLYRERVYFRPLER